MSGQHATSINGAGNPVFEDIKQVAQSSRISNRRSIVEEVRDGVASWSKLASQYDVGAPKIEEIARALKAVDQACAP